MPRIIFSVFFLLSILLCLAPVALGAGADDDWKIIVALDAGPKQSPRTPQEARQVAQNHLALQRRAVESFASKYPDDLRAFDARMRLASIVAAQGKMFDSRKQVDAALQMFGELEKSESAPREKRADAAFQRASLYLQSQQGSTDRMREGIVTAAKNFTHKYPGDRRGPRLLVEVATICDDSPTLKKQLLLQADRLTSEAPLKARIADDLKRLARLGRPLELSLNTVKHGPLKLSALRGTVVVLVFWSAESPHSLLWLRDFRASWEELPKNQLQVITVSLDTDRKTLNEKLTDLPAQWPTHYDGKGWYSPLARELGINALPSVWVLDKKGVLRTLNGQTGYETRIRQLLRE